MPLSSDVVVVSGLPRSGTSLMMQMLERGGISPMTDAIRTADVDNPNGYFEFERVKRTKEDPSWLKSATGHAVKIVSSLLYDLPDTERYRVVFMRRDLDEVLDSQEKMLQRFKRPCPPRDQMKSAFTIHLDKLFQWLETQSQFQILEVNYNDLLKEPQGEIERIVQFLDNELDASRMLESIDPSLYRNRKSLRSESESRE